MSMATVDINSNLGHEEEVHYRALHTGSLISLVLGIVSVFVVITAASSFEWCLLAAPIPALGMFIGLRSLAKIRRHPDQYTGSGLAKVGVLLSLMFLVGGVGYGGDGFSPGRAPGDGGGFFFGIKTHEMHESGGGAVSPRGNLPKWE